MRAFGEIGLDLDQIGADLDALERFLSEEKHRTERADILPFFKARPNLSAALGLTNSAIEAPDRVAFELDLFGDFVCDVANGDSSTNAFTLIEFEDAQEQSIFRKLDHGKSMKRWSPRFERGFSQLVDWAWRLSTEGGTSDALRRVFGNSHPDVHLLLVVGRDADLTGGDLNRLQWRSRNVSFGSYRMSCFTFDGILQSIRRRLQLAKQ
ncbi:hypothetical protein STAQ_18250 [Allostella sp. ATCC 35155]|nr:hypothetical protein STAQ_18250 [Stella sp. ATCC 35155]